MVRVVEPLTLPSVAVMVVEPMAVVVARPVLAPMVAVAVLEELQVTALVMT